MSEDIERRARLQKWIGDAIPVADWIYHDVRFDIDSQAPARTAHRLQVFHDAYGREAMFGIAGAWALKAYWRLQDAWLRKGIQTPPRLIPGNMLEELPNSNERKRAYVTAQQFASAIAADDYEMAEAIFNAAYDASYEDASSLLFCILLISIKLSSDAKRMINRG